MANNVCIQLPFDCPYPNPVFVDSQPVFVINPESDAWDDWLFGPDATSLVGLVNGRTLTVNGTPTVGPTYTVSSVTPADNPNAFDTGFPDSQVMTQIAAFIVPSANRSVCGSFSASGASSFGTSINWSPTDGPNVQFGKRRGSVGSVVQTITVPGAVAGDLVIAALVDNNGTSSCYVHGVSTTATLAGEKILAVGNVGLGSLYNTAGGGYVSGAETCGLQLYASALSESVIREKMQRLEARVLARR